MTIAESIRALPPEKHYGTCVARMAYRDFPTGNDRVTFHFEDGSSITFQKVYQIEEEPAED